MGASRFDQVYERHTHPPVVRGMGSHVGREAVCGSGRKRKGHVKPPALGPDDGGE